MGVLEGRRFERLHRAEDGIAARRNQVELRLVAKLAQLGPRDDTRGLARASMDRRPTSRGCERLGAAVAARPAGLRRRRRRGSTATISTSFRGAGLAVNRTGDRAANHVRDADSGQRVGDQACDRDWFRERVRRHPSRRRRDRPTRRRVATWRRAREAPHAIHRRNAAPGRPERAG